jgi:hypothetical protein
MVFVYIRLDAKPVLGISGVEYRNKQQCRARHLHGERLCEPGYVDRYWGELE